MARTYDVSLAGGAADLLSGPAALAQRFLVELLTERGSLPGRPERGTDFARSLRARLFQGERDVFVRFAAALPGLAANLRGEESEADDPAGRYGSAELAGMSLAGGTLTLEIEVTPLGGEGPPASLTLSARY